MLIKITGESVNLSEARIFRKLYKYELAALHIITELTSDKHSHFITFHSFITISQHLESNVKIQNDPNKQIRTTTERSVP